MLLHSLVSSIRTLFVFYADPDIQVLILFIMYASQFLN